MLIAVLAATGVNYSSGNLVKTSSGMMWKNAAKIYIPAKAERKIIPRKYRVMDLETGKLEELLNLAPAEDATASEKKNTVITIPLPDGSNCDFYVCESPIMDVELGAKYPMLKTYSIKSIDNNAFTGRIDFTPLGFHAIIFSPEGTIYVDPYSTENGFSYLCYYKKDYITDEKLIPVLNCTAKDRLIKKNYSRFTSGKTTATNVQLRKYRLALAATGEYTAYYGGTVAGALSGIVTTMNRINAIYEKELAIRMILVANNDKLIFTNSKTDPYKNESGDDMLIENQNTIDSVIGSANYDIGHVFSTGGGGLAEIASVCFNNYKAQGVTGSSNPVGDAYDVDYVAHEMGHQFGADHTFNSNTGSCDNSTIVPEQAYEPGSGSTIMAYAGICSPQDIQQHSDDYFHIASLNQINNFSVDGDGYACAAVSSAANTNPIVTVGAGGFIIPVNTPFTLTGSAVDAENDSLTYCWEEYDLGPNGDPDKPVGTAPIFRSFKPVSSSSRTFPQIADILNNKHTYGELLPQYTRTLTFILTARDNKGGIGFNTIQFKADNSSGPFTVAYPNSNITWQTSSKQTISWNVASTDKAPVNCSRVNILLSTDGGNTFPTVLAANTPNDGSEEIIVPGYTAEKARIKIEAADNIFFDISDVDFTIKYNSVPVELISFSVKAEKKGVQLNWQTATETNSNGFYVERSSDKINFYPIAFIPSTGTTLQKNSYNYFDNISGNGVYSYRLKQVDNNASYTYSNTVDIVLSAKYEFALEQNYPNPFNPVTTIRYTIQTQEYVLLKVYDILGREIIRLVNEVQPAGNYKVEFNSASYPSGVYYYQLSAGNNSLTKKMISLK